MAGFVFDVVFYFAPLTLILFALMSSFLRRRSSRVSPHPPSVGLLGCPLFGHLSVLGSHPHRSLTQLSRRLGPVYSLQLGRRQAVVVNGRAAVRATFSTAAPAGRLLGDRPDFELYRSYAGGCSISFGRHGAAVRLQRRLARSVIRRLITSGLAERIIEREAAALVAQWTDDSYRQCGRCLDPADDITTAVSSALFSMCYGLDNRISDDPEFQALLKSKGSNSDVFAIGKQSDLLPSCLRRFIVDSHKVAAVIRQMETHVRLNTARVQQRSAPTWTTQDDEDSDGDVLDAVLTAAQSPTTLDRMCSAGLTHAHLTSLPLEFLSAGSETSSATLIWILRFVVMHPAVQRRVHAELDRELVAGHPVKYEDRRRLPYVEAVVLEAMRMAPVVPLALPHFTDVDVDIANTATEGCDHLTIPAGSIVIANLWSVGRDPDVWNGDAIVFRPERFLRSRNSSTQFANSRTHSYPFVANINDENRTDSASNEISDDAVESRSLVVDSRLMELFYPFSFGARRCVGESLGRLQIFVFFATIMRSCRLLQVDGKPPPSNGETYGDVIRPAPYEIRIVPRYT